MGPYTINKDGRTLNQNQFSWNRYASIAYIEAPAGVGFSYASDGNTTTNDDQVEAIGSEYSDIVINFSIIGNILN
jgi:carboxypeptidase C (cathepsin A)